MPVEIFDRRKYIADIPWNAPDADVPTFNSKTLAFRLVTPKVAKSASRPRQYKSYKELAEGLFRVYFKAESLMRGMQPYNKYRIVDVSNCGVETTQFDLDKTTQDKL